MADWDTTNPDDNDIVSQYPSNERAARGAVVTNFDVDHHATDDADVGKHEVVNLLDQAGDATVGANDIGIWNDGGVLKTRQGTGSVNQIARISDVGNAAFATGTRMLFHQASAPTGWTQATDVNDRVMRVVSGGTGGGVGGTWTISGLTVQNHTLTISQMPAHDHGTTRTTSTDTHSHSGTTSNDSHNHTQLGSGSDRAGTGSNNFDAVRFITANTSTDTHNHSFGTNSDSHNHTVNIPSEGGGSAHNHGITHNGGWRPSYTDVIVAAKD